MKDGEIIEGPNKGKSSRWFRPDNDHGIHRGCQRDRVHDEPDGCAWKVKVFLSGGWSDQDSGGKLGGVQRRWCETV